MLLCAVESLQGKIERFTDLIDGLRQSPGRRYLGKEIGYVHSITSILRFVLEQRPKGLEQS